MLLEALWGGSEYREPRTIDVHVRHLREKLEADPSEPGSSSPCAASATASATDERRSAASARGSRSRSLLVVASRSGIVYVVVVPPLENRLIDAKLDQLERVAHDRGPAAADLGSAAGGRRLRDPRVRAS